LASWALAALAAAPTAACRCPQLTLERYFERAGVVLVGEVTAVRREAIDGVEVLAVEVEPRFRTEGFKGEVGEIELVTPESSARCGIAVEAGEIYLIFASRLEPDGTVAWFDSCGGSRLYAGGPRAAEIEPFSGLPRHRIVPRLFELSGAAPAADAEVGSPFQTSPACWSAPRTFHTGAPQTELRQRVNVSFRRLPEASTGVAAAAEPVVSPNGAYRAWVRAPHEETPGVRRAAVVVDVEREDLLWVALSDAAWAPEIRWINEKLLFLRVAWGRVVASDLILDVEAGALIYEELALDGSEAFRQFAEQCAGQCPCAAEPGSLSEAASAPISRPAQGEPGIETLRGLVRSLTYLDADWDGRIYSRPGGTVSTLSALPGARRRAEHPVEVTEVRETAGGPWLEVRLYAGNPCDDPHTPVAHAGWIPAYSASGALVASTYPGGC
jgi:hypothetical protein